MSDDNAELETHEEVEVGKTVTGLAPGKRHELRLRPFDIDRRVITSFDPRKAGTIQALQEATNAKPGAKSMKAGALNQRAFYEGGLHLLLLELMEEPDLMSDPADLREFRRRMTRAYGDSIDPHKAFTGVAGYHCVVIAHYLAANSALELAGATPMTDVKAYFRDGLRNGRWNQDASVSNPKRYNWWMGASSVRGLEEFSGRTLVSHQEPPIVDTKKDIRGKLVPDRIRALLAKPEVRERLVHVRRDKPGGHSFTIAWDGSKWVCIDSMSMGNAKGPGRNGNVLNERTLFFGGAADSYSISYLEYYEAR